MTKLTVDAAIAADMAREFERRRHTAPRSRPRLKRRKQPGPENPWSAAELDRLREIYSKHTKPDVARMMRRTVASVKSKAKKLQLGTRRYWTPSELAVVRDMYRDHSTKEIAEKLGRPPLSVYQAADKMGLKKTEKFLQTVGFQKGHQYGVEFQFKKGQAPVNKGMRRPGWAPGRMAETQFRKGGRPHTWRPIGTIQADSEGYLRIKVRERDPEMPQRGWHPDVWPLLHRKTWEDHYGPVPEGHAIAFKDGNRQNCAIENLECIPRAELAERNRMWNRYPRELAEAIQLHGVLKRKLRRCERGEEQHV
jgi:hypothetical protein